MLMHFDESIETAKAIENLKEGIMEAAKAYSEATYEKCAKYTDYKGFPIKVYINTPEIDGTHVDVIALEILEYLEKLYITEEQIASASCEFYFYDGRLCKTHMESK